jgi:hypothetical protein
MVKRQPCQEELHLNFLTNAANIQYFCIDGICGIVFNTQKPYIKPKQIKLPKETGAKRNIRIILENFNNKEFDSYEVTELLNLSTSGAYKFLAAMCKGNILCRNKGDNNKLFLFSIYFENRFYHL